MTLKEQAVQNLRDIKEILDYFSVTYWLDGGTLLGAYRDNDFPDGDEDDIDICAWDNYIFLYEHIIKKAEELGFTVYHRWELEFALIRGESKVDIFFIKKKNHQCYTHIYKGNEIYKWVVIPARYYEVLSNIKFYRMDFLCPSPIEEYLSHKYGDWKTPIHRSIYSCANSEQHKFIKDHYEE